MSADKLPYFHDCDAWAYAVGNDLSGIEIPDEFAARELGRVALSLGLDADCLRAMAWRSVADALPDYPEGELRGHLCVDGFGSVYIETTRPSYWNKKDPKGRADFDGPTVTHWMPLPKAPKSQP